MGGKSLKHGVGINDADYAVSNRINGEQVCCKFYKVWSAMLERSYSKSKILKFPTYIGCSVCEEWLTFSNFKAWMEVQDYDGKELDKDLLVQGNKVYSPDTCIFIPKRVNTLLINCGKVKGACPTGVYFNKRVLKFHAQINNRDKPTRTHLGFFNTAEEAHAAWQAAKRGIIMDVAMEQSDERLRNALLLRCVQLQHDIDNGLETIKL